MAKKHSESTEPVTTEETANVTPIREETSVPTGYEEFGISGPQYWWSVTEGAEIEGELLGVEKRRPDPSEPNKENQYIARIKVIRPTRCIFDGDAIEAPVGTVVCLDVKYDLQPLVPLAQDANRWQVYLRAVEKKKLEGKRSMWVYAKGRRNLGLKPSLKDSTIPF